MLQTREGISYKYGSSDFHFCGICDALPTWLNIPVSFRPKPAGGMHTFIMIWTISLAIPVHVLLEGEM